MNKSPKKRIVCKCGKYIYLRTFSRWEGGIGKTHAHCFKCRLEWHWNMGRVYAHPFIPRKEVRNSFKKKAKIKKQKPSILVIKQPKFNPEIKTSFGFMEIAHE